jgi:hypothetical protein
MAVEKISVSMDSALIELVRKAANEAGLSVSTWLAEAAQAQARNLALREALDDLDRRLGAVPGEEADKLIAEALAKSVTSRPRKRRK